MTTSLLLILPRAKHMVSIIYSFFFLTLVLGLGHWDIPPPALTVNLSGWTFPTGCDVAHLIRLLSLPSDPLVMTGFSASWAAVSMSRLRAFHPWYSPTPASGTSWLFFFLFYKGSHDLHVLCRLRWWIFPRWKIQPLEWSISAIDVITDVDHLRWTVQDLGRHIIFVCNRIDFERDGPGPWVWQRCNMAVEQGLDRTAVSRCHFSRTLLHLDTNVCPSIRWRWFAHDPWGQKKCYFMW